MIQQLSLLEIPSKVKRRIRKPIEMIKASNALMTKNTKTVAEIVRIPDPRPHPMMSDPRYLERIFQWKRKHHIEESGMNQEQSIKFGDFLEKLLLEWDGKK